MNNGIREQWPLIKIGRGKDKREEGDRGRDAEVGIEDNNAITLSMAEEANAFSAGNNRACSDERSREDKCSSS